MNARHATVLSITVCTFCGDLPLLLFLRATIITSKAKTCVWRTIFFYINKVNKWSDFICGVMFSKQAMNSYNNGSDTISWPLIIDKISIIIPITACPLFWFLLCMFTVWCVVQGVKKKTLIALSFWILLTYTVVEVANQVICIGIGITFLLYC